MFCFCRKSPHKIKSFDEARKFWVSVWKSEVDFTNVPFWSVLLCSLQKANCAFRSRIQRLYRNIASFCTCGEFCECWNSGSESDFGFFWIALVFNVIIENLQILLFWWTYIKCDHKHCCSVAREKSASLNFDCLCAKAIDCGNFIVV